MSGKDAIMARLRNALNVPGQDQARMAAIAERMAKAPQGVIPQRGQLPDQERVGLFVTMAEKANATVTRISGISELPAEISQYLRSRNLPACIRMGDDPELAKAPWSKEQTLEIHKGASDGNDLAGLSHGFAAVAESGTLVMVSGPDNPTTVNFLPEHHIVLLKASDIKGDMESAMQDVRKAYGKGEMPRVVNMITGPSRSGDIEQILLLGAHGPRALHIVIME